MGYVRRTLAALILVSSLAPLHADGSGAFTLDWATDLSVGIPAVAVFAAGELIPAPSSGAPFGWFDEAWGLDYDHDLAKISDVTSVAALAAIPFLVDRWDAENLGTLTVMTVETALLSVGSKDLLKALTKRSRPYVAFPDGQGAALDPEDRFVSFPSGHSTLAFTSAAFVTTVFARGSSDNAWKWGMGAGTFALAGATATLRVLAGEHHVTDVVAGALLGTLIGAAVPWLHDKGPDTGFRGLTASFSY